MDGMLFNINFEQMACDALLERFNETLSEYYKADDVSFMTHNHGDDRLFSALVTVRSGNDTVDFSVNVFPNGNSLIYSMDDDPAFAVEKVEKDLKAGVEVWKKDDPYFSDMVTIKDAVNKLSCRKDKKGGIEI